MSLARRQSIPSLVLIFAVALFATRVAAEQDAVVACTSESPASSSTESGEPASRKSFADEGQFAEAAAVMVMDQFMCSGSLISEDAVLTAAICLGILPDLKPEEVRVIAGNINRTKGKSIVAKKILVHPLFRYYPRQTVLEHDIAIIQLARPFNTAEGKVSTIKLPTAKEAKTDLTKLEGVVAGWGAVARRNKMLQFVNVTISSQSQCSQFYQNLSPAPYTLEHFQMCSEATEDLCIGESGAGLRVYFEGESEPTLVGIAEPSADCPNPKRPEIYTRVSEYLDWIEKSLK